MSRTETCQSCLIYTRGQPVALVLQPEEIAELLDELGVSAPELPAAAGEPGPRQLSIMCRSASCEACPGSWCQCACHEPPGAGPSAG